MKKNQWTGLITRQMDDLKDLSTGMNKWLLVHIIIDLCQKDEFADNDVGENGERDVNWPGMKERAAIDFIEHY